MKNYKMYTQKLTTCLEGFSREACCPGGSDAWEYECIRAACTVAVRSTYINNTVSAEVGAKIHISQNPYMIHALSDIKKGELKFMAASNRIDNKGPSESKMHSASSAAFSLGAPGMSCSSDMFIHPQFTPPIDAKGMPNDAPWVCEFWLV